MAEPELTFFHAPNTRSSTTMMLLEELGAPFTLNPLNMTAGEHRQQPYLATNPMGKVPAIRHGDAVITETVAITIYLADCFPNAGLAPSLTDPLRGPYLRWLVYYAACFEPAVIDRALKREPGPKPMLPYGDYDTTLATVLAQLSPGPWLLGDRFTAADVVWGTGLSWITSFGLVEKTPAVAAYLDRFEARPARIRAKARDVELTAGQQNAPAVA